MTRFKMQSKSSRSVRHYDRTGGSILAGRKPSPLALFALSIVVSILLSCGGRNRGHVVVSAYYQNDSSQGVLAATSDLVGLFVALDKKLGEDGYRLSVMSLETLQEAGTRDDYVWMHVNLSRSRSSGYSMFVRTPGARTSWTDHSPDGLGFSSPQLERVDFPKFEIFEQGLEVDTERISFNTSSDLFEQLVSSRWKRGFRDSPDFQHDDTAKR